MHDAGEKTRRRLHKQSAAIFLLEIEGFLNEDAQRRFAMRVAPKTENGHLFVDDPISSAFGIGKVFRPDRNRRRVANGRESGKSVANLFGLEINDEIDIERDSSVAMRVDSDPTATMNGTLASFSVRTIASKLATFITQSLFSGEAVFQIIRSAHVIVQPLTHHPRMPPAFLTEIR